MYLLVGQLEGLVFGYLCLLVFGVSKICELFEASEIKCHSFVVPSAPEQINRSKPAQAQPEGDNPNMHVVPVESHGHEGFEFLQLVCVLVICYARVAPKWHDSISKLQSQVSCWY